MNSLTPREIVKELDRFIVGQTEAKKAVAVALRNRYRRAMLPEDIREEVTPKNILMMGPTGVGKTEIARRLAKLVDAPFVKVEATKFTEVGYVGRDVESMIRDLVEASIHMVKKEHSARVHFAAQQNAEEKIVDMVAHPAAKKKAVNPIDILLGNKPKEPEVPAEQREEYAGRREEIRRKLAEGKLEDTIVQVEVEETKPSSEIPGMDINVSDMLGNIMPPKMKQRKVTVREARKILTAQEEQNLIDMDAVYTEALMRAEQDGIIFLDEIDKVAGGAKHNGPDVSREGVQRDILPIVEGSTVNTKYGPVKTDHMLFIAAGAFHVSSVSDLIPELQGRFPVRVKLQPLALEDYERILTQPENSLVRQYQLLLKVDGVDLKFDESAVHEIAQYAYNANETDENIGARRLHTVLEEILNDISFNAVAGDGYEVTVTVDDNYVKTQLKTGMAQQDIHQFIL